MTTISHARLARFWQRSDKAQTPTEKGKALEDLISYLFGKIPGFSLTTRNENNIFHTEEIDVAFWNDKHRQGAYFLPYTILVECKNWSHSVGSTEVGWFDTILRNRGLTFGILIAANGITGNAYDRTAAHSIIAAALREQRQIIIITRQELELTCQSHIQLGGLSP